MSPVGSNAVELNPRAPGDTTLAVVVTAGVTPYLRHTLSGVARQTVDPGAVVVVDVASRVNGLGDGTPVEEVVADSGVDAHTRVRIVRVPEARGFGDAVSRGLERYAELLEGGSRRRAGRRRSAGSPDTPGTGLQALLGSDAAGDGDAADPDDEADSAARSAHRAHGAHGTRGHLWLLHDDSAPEPGCLEVLLTAITQARSASLVGPKQVDWDHPEALLEVGLRTTPSARRADDIVAGEIDQGQYDDRSDVLAVGTAGALIERSVWEELGGTSPEFPVFGDGLELSRAVRLAGHRVLVVPGAVVRHRRAGYLGLRPFQLRAAERRRADDGPAAIAPGPPEPDVDRSFLARRTAHLTAWATFSARPAGPLVLWFLVLATVRATGRLLTKSPGLARDELGAALRVLRRPGAVRRGRARLAEHATVRRTVLNRLYVDASHIRAVRRDHRRQERERIARAQAPSELELRELRILARRRRAVLLGTLVVTGLVGAFGLNAVLATRAVTGGAAVSLGIGGRGLWNAAWATWATSGDGYPAAAQPLLALLAVPVGAVGRLGLSGDGLFHLLVLAAVPLAALGAWFAAGTATRSTGLRAWAALTWALAPALLLAVGQGRATAVLVHLALPWALTALARAVGADRRDVVFSGMVDAHHATAQEKADLDRFASERIEDLAELSADDAEDAADFQDSPGSGDSADSADSAASAASAASAGSADSAEEPRERTVALARILMDTEEIDAEETGETEESEENAQDAPGAGTAGSAASPASAASPEDAEEPEDSADSKDSKDSKDAKTPAKAGSGKSRGAVPEPAVLGVAARAATVERYGPGSPTAAAVAGLFLAVVVAAAPVVAAVVVAFLLVLMVTVRRAALRLVLTVLPVVATAAPAWWRAAHIAMDGGRAAAVRYLLTDIGGPVAVPAPSAVDTLLGLPVDVDALAPGWAGTARLLLAVLLALALCGLAVPGRRGHHARAGVLAAAGGLALALASARVTTAVGTLPDSSGTVTVPGWAGVGISLATAGALVAALAVADAVRARLARHEIGWRRGIGAALVLVLIAVPVAIGGAWAAKAHASSTVGDNALFMALRPVGRQVPIIASEIQRSPAAGRVVVLTSTPDGLSVKIWRGEGRRLTDVLPDVLDAQWRDRLAPAGGDVEPARSVSELEPADAALADVVTRATIGQDGTVADDLAAHGVAVVLLTTAEDDLTAQVRAGLESTPGLDRLAQTDAGRSWRVSPSTGPEAARLTLVSADDTTTTAVTVPTTSADGVSTTTVLPPSDDGRPRTLVLAERADAGWYATLDGTPLEAVAPPDGHGWRQAFAVPASGGELVLAHGTMPNTALTRLIWVAWAVTALAALPLRRRRTIA